MDKFKHVLDDASAAELLDLGFRRWSREELFEDKQLFLIPERFYNQIPENYVLMSISGQWEIFKRGKTDNDTRGGMLAFGVLR